MPTAVGPNPLSIFQISLYDLGMDVFLLFDFIEELSPLSSSGGWSFSTVIVGYPIYLRCFRRWDRCLNPNIFSKVSWGNDCIYRREECGYGGFNNATSCSGIACDVETWYCYIGFWELKSAFKMMSSRLEWLPLVLDNVPFLISN